MKGEDDDGIMWWQVRGGPAYLPTGITKETKEVMIRAIAMEKMRLMRFPDGLKDYWKEWEILNEMLVMVKEYHSPPGFKSMKRAWDNGSFCREGRLKRGNMQVGHIIGEIVDFVSPSVDVERIVNKHVKAIAVVETWRTEERFIKAWETDVFKGEKRERADIRYIYLGWQLMKYIGIDNPLTEENEGDSHMFAKSVQFDRSKLGMFWNRAVITLNAMQIVDCLYVWAYNQILSGIERPFLFGWENRN
jgi:hypothetical protein